MTTNRSPFASLSETQLGDIAGGLRVSTLGLPAGTYEMIPVGPTATPHPHVVPAIAAPGFSSPTFSSPGYSTSASPTYVPVVVEPQPARVDPIAAVTSGILGALLGPSYYDAQAARSYDPRVAPRYDSRYAPTSLSSSLSAYTPYEAAEKSAAPSYALDPYNDYSDYGSFKY